jgi:dihydroneopterin triphosphate diphosphatase
VVDVHVLRVASGGLEALALRRAPGDRSPGSWEAVHGTIEPGETPVDAALRELTEETGLVPDRLYNLSRVEMFYLHRNDTVVLGPVFAALVSSAQSPRLSAEHDGFAWLPPREAAARYALPRLARALEDAIRLLGTDGGGATLLDDVLRVR